MDRIYVDFSGLEGTNCYCTADNARLIRRRIASLDCFAFHVIGTGDYHYQTLFWLERLSCPFVLILFDNHPDDQPDAFGAGMISCGGWVADARRLPYCREDIWIRSEADFPDLDRLPDLPVYISIDLDVLAPDHARTDWDQGTMSLDALCSALRRLIGSRHILGVDLCGGLTLSKGASPKDLALNAGTGEALYALFRNLTDGSRR